MGLGTLCVQESKKKRPIHLYMSLHVCLVLQIIWYRAYIGRDRLQIASIVLLGIAALCSLRFLLPGSVAHDQLLDSERYT